MNCLHFVWAHTFIRTPLCIRTSHHNSHRLKNSETTDISTPTFGNTFMLITWFLNVSDMIRCSRIEQMFDDRN